MSGNRLYYAPQNLLKFKLMNKGTKVRLCKIIQVDCLFQEDVLFGKEESWPRTSI